MLTMEKQATLTAILETCISILPYVSWIHVDITSIIYRHKSNRNVCQVTLHFVTSMHVYWCPLQNLLITENTPSREHNREQGNPWKLSLAKIEDRDVLYAFPTFGDWHQAPLSSTRIQKGWVLSGRKCSTEWVKESQLDCCKACSCVTGTHLY